MRWLVISILIYSSVPAFGQQQPRPPTGPSVQSSTSASAVCINTGNDVFCRADAVINGAIISVCTKNDEQVPCPAQK
jgi:hypothetical protein